MRYGPTSYYSLGRVYPRDRQREPFRQRSLRAVRGVLLIPFVPPVIPAPPSGIVGVLLLAKADGTVGWLNSKI